MVETTQEGQEDYRLDNLPLEVYKAFDPDRLRAAFFRSGLYEGAIEHFKEVFDKFLRENPKRYSEAINNAKKAYQFLERDVTYYKLDNNFDAFFIFEDELKKTADSILSEKIATNLLNYWKNLESLRDSYVKLFAYLFSNLEDSKQSEELFNEFKGNLENSTKSSTAKLHSIVENNNLPKETYDFLDEVEMATYLEHRYFFRLKTTSPPYSHEIIEKLPGKYSLNGLAGLREYFSEGARPLKDTSSKKQSIFKRIREKV